MRPQLLLLATLAWAVTASAQVPSYVPTDGLVAWYSLEGSLTNSVNPSEVASGSASLLDSAAFFDNTELLLPNSSLPTEFSISFDFWVDDLDVQGGQYPYLMGLDENEVPDLPGIGYQATPTAYCGSSAMMSKLFLFDGATGCTNVFNSTATITEGGWNRVSISKGASDLIIQLNGEAATYSGAVSFSIDQIRVGNRQNGLGFQGHLRRVGLWNRALNEAELEQLGSTPSSEGETPSYVPTDGLVAWYPMNGNALDESGNGYDCQSIGATLTEDRFGAPSSAYAFDGQGSHLQGSSLPFSDLSISLWFKAEAGVFETYSGGTPPTGAQLIGQGTTHSPCRYCDWAIGISDWTDGVDKLAWEKANSSSCQVQQTVTTWEPELSEWTHLVAVSEGTDVSFYINGDWVSTIAFDQPFQQGGSILSIGSRYVENCNGGGSCTGPDNAWSGSIDDVAVWNRMLSTEEINALYGASSTEDDGSCLLFDGVTWEIEHLTDSVHLVAEHSSWADLDLPSGLHIFGSHGDHLYLYTDEVDSWSNNRNLCESASSQLTSIHNESENQFITSILEQHAVTPGGGHLGASDAGSEGNWQWVDGTPWNYENWAGVEPSNSWGGEHYGQIYSSGLWNDCRDNAGPDAHIAVCKKTISHRLSWDQSGSSSSLGLGAPLPQTIELILETDLGSCSQSVSIQVSNPTFGCTDAMACNYNADATQDDGSCIDLSLSLDDVTISPEATATLDSNVPTTSTGTVCATRNENEDPITLTAPAGGVFTSVEFASYGTPNGSCGSYSTGSCHASSSTQVVSNLCIGQNSCTIYPNNSTFGDPCVGTGKRLFIELGYQSTSEFDVSWSNGSTEPSITVQPTETTTYTITVTTPEGSCTESATVTVTVPGCTDSSACNYNEEADEDDGSCSYPPAFLVNGTAVVDTVFAELNETLVFESATQTEADSTLLDAFSVFFNAFSAHSLPVLEAGTDYRLIATGRYGFADGWTHNDAAFNYAWDVETGTKVNCNGTQDAQEDVRWLYDGATDFQRPDNDTDNNAQFCSGVDKTYFWTLPGDDNSHTVGFIDGGGYGDNSGELSFQLYELSNAAGITWPNGSSGASWSYEAAATGIFDFTLSSGPCSVNLVIVVGHPGCTDETACNFDSTAVLEDGSCVYADPGADCSDNCPEWPEDTVMQCLNSSTVLDAGIQRGTYFDGIDDYILMSESGVTGTNPMTISYWALTTNNQRMDIFSQACDSDCGTDIRLGMNTPQCGLVGPSFKSPAHFATFPFDVDDGNWHQYTYVFGDGSFSYNNLKIYVDGTLFSAATVDDYCGHNWGGWTYNAQDIPIRLGYGLPLGGMFSGYLDDVAVWEEALQPDEVHALLTASPSQIGDQLLSYWPLDELQNGFFTDVVGGNDGAPIGGIGEDPADARGVVTWYSGTQMPVIEVFPNQTTTYTAEMVLTTGQVCQDSIVIEVGTDLFSDVDGNGICDAFEQEGCTDEAACNYNPNAISDDGSCDYTCCPGPGCCDDPSQWDAALQQCHTAALDTIVVTDTLLVPTPFCGAGTHWDPVTEMCIADVPGTTDENCTVMNLQELAEGYQVLLDHTFDQDSIILAQQATIDALDAVCGCSAPVSYQGHDYEVVEIGGQCWFAENLQSESYRNGDAIPTLPNNGWSDTANGAQAAFDNDETNVSTYGRLYNWHSVNDSRQLCPSGWHVPDDAEWQVLIDGIGAQGGLQLKASSGWTAGPNGTDTHGFDGRPAGYRGASGSYANLGSLATWWSATPNENGGDAHVKSLIDNSDEVYQQQGISRQQGRSIRCLKN